MSLLLLLLLALPALAQPTSPAQKLEEARAAVEAEPRNVENLIWLGRRLGYLGRFAEALDVYTRALSIEPENAKLYRHRGHRYISTRRFAEAIADLEKAAQLIQGQIDEVEPDGLPNRLNQPRSTLQFNIYYHLALAHYLRGDFLAARAAFEQCMQRSRANDDLLVATTDWLYMTLRRLGLEKEAQALLQPIREKMDIIENDSYHRRLLMYKGLRKPEELLAPQGADALSLATQGYGVGNWYLYNGDRARAREVFSQVVAGQQQAAFGYIAAEVDLRRMK